MALQQIELTFRNLVMYQLSITSSWSSAVIDESFHKQF